MFPHAGLGPRTFGLSSKHLTLRPLNWHPSVLMSKFYQPTMSIQNLKLRILKELLLHDKFESDSPSFTVLGSITKLFDVDWPYVWVWYLQLTDHWVVFKSMSQRIFQFVYLLSILYYQINVCALILSLMLILLCFIKSYQLNLNHPYTI